MFKQKGYNISTVALRGGTHCNGMLFLYVLKTTESVCYICGVKFKNIVMYSIEVTTTYTNLYFVGMIGFEPIYFCLQDKCYNRSNSYKHYCFTREKA